jgi:hypothetical protein
MKNDYGLLVHELFAIARADLDDTQEKLYGDRTAVILKRRTVNMADGLRPYFERLRSIYSLLTVTIRLTHGQNTVVIRPPGLRQHTARIRYVLARSRPFRCRIKAVNCRIRAVPSTRNQSPGMEFGECILHPNIFNRFMIRTSISRIFRWTTLFYITC